MLRWWRRALGVAAALAVLLVGLWGSLFPTQVLNGARTWVGAAAAGTGHTWVFVVLLGIAIVSLVAQAVVGEAADRQWVPTYSFLHEWGVLVEKAQLVVDTLHAEERTEGEVEDALRMLLHILAACAARFEGQPAVEGGRPQISANLMLFVPLPEAGAWHEHLRFAAGLDPRRFEGVLVLRPALSATAASPTPCKVPQIALLVPSAESMRKENGRWTALPGAPLAYARGALELISNPAKMAKWTRKHSDFPPSAADEVEQYFRTRSAGGLAGFLSLPVFELSAEYQSTRRVVGVVNIDWTTAVHLRTQRDARAFAALAYPLVSLLALALEGYALAIAHPDGSGYVAAVQASDESAKP